MTTITTTTLVNTDMTYKSPYSEDGRKNQKTAIKLHGYKRRYLFLSPSFQKQIEKFLKSSGRDKHLRSVRVFYLAKIVSPQNIPHYLTAVPLICTDGDQNIQLQNGKVYSQGGQIDIKKLKCRLLTYKERKFSRKKVIASQNKVFGYGGYHSDIVEYAEPQNCIIISAAGPQFEITQLEYSDFIIDKNSKAITTPDFPYYYPHSNYQTPTYQEIKDTMDASDIDEDEQIIINGLLKKNKTSKEIARRLGKSENVIQIYAESFRKKQMDTDLEPLDELTCEIIDSLHARKKTLFEISKRTNLSEDLIQTYINHRQTDSKTESSKNDVLEMLTKPEDLKQCVINTAKNQSESLEAARKCVRSYFGPTRKHFLQDEGLNHWYKALWNEVKGNSNVLIGILLLEKSNDTEKLSKYCPEGSKTIQLVMGTIAKELLIRHSPDLSETLQEILIRKFPLRSQQIKTYESKNHAGKEIQLSNQNSMIKCRWGNKCRYLNADHHGHKSHITQYSHPDLTEKITSHPKMYDYILLPKLNAIFNRGAYKISMQEDIFLILKSFDLMVMNKNKADGTKKKGFLKAVAVGMGFFSVVKRVYSIRNLLAPIMLDVYHEILTSKQFQNIGVIEFPDFMHGLYTPSWGDFPINGIKILKGQKRSACEFTPSEFSKYICGTVNAGDCFCIPGNEEEYASVEAMIGNNTDLRAVQAYFYNHHLLNYDHYIKI